MWIHSKTLAEEGEVSSPGSNYLSLAIICGVGGSWLEAPVLRMACVTVCAVVAYYAGRVSSTVPKESV